MTEVFRTNVRSTITATNILTVIHQEFPAYSANFDLQDRDRILRVCAMSDEVNSEAVCTIVEAQGFRAEILPDEVPAYPPEGVLF
jgi:hypothetical protein